MKGRPSLRKGQKSSPETKDRISKAQDYKKRPVSCVTTGEIFDSKYDVVQRYGYDKGHLIHHLKTINPRSGVKGLFFRFVDQYDPNVHKPLKVETRPIVVHDNDGNYVNEYLTQFSCKTDLDIPITVSLKRYLHGQGLSYKGYHFSYKGAL